MEGKVMSRIAIEHWQKQIARLFDPLNVPSRLLRKPDSSVMHRDELSKPSYKARPMTRRQELLFIASAFAVGGVLQMLVLLHLGVILESGLARIVATIWIDR